MDHVDHDAVLDLVLRAGDQLGGDPRIGVGVAGARRRAGERVGPHDVAVDLDEQFGEAPIEPVDRVPIARTERRAQAPKHGVHVDRSIAVTVISRAITALTSSPDRVASRAAVTAAR